MRSVTYKRGEILRALGAEAPLGLTGAQGRSARAHTIFYVHQAVTRNPVFDMSLASGARELRVGEKYPKHAFLYNQMLKKFKSVIFAHKDKRDKWLDAEVADDITANGTATKKYDGRLSDDFIIAELLMYPQFRSLAHLSSERPEQIAYLITELFFAESSSNPVVRQLKGIIDSEIGADLKLTKEKQAEIWNKVFEATGSAAFVN